jgi:hypothetical protein
MLNFRIAQRRLTRMAYHASAAIGSSSSGPLFAGRFTCRLTGQTRSTPGGKGTNSAAGSPLASPNQIGQCSGSRTTGIRSCSASSSSFARVVTIVKVRSTCPSGPRQPSHRSSAIRLPWQSRRAVSRFLDRCPHRMWLLARDIGGRRRRHGTCRRSPQSRRASGRLPH